MYIADSEYIAKRREYIGAAHLKRSFKNAGDKMPEVRRGVSGRRDRI